MNQLLPIFNRLIGVHGNKSPKEMERYFYHSFPRPRRGRDQTVDVQKGLKILELIRDFGLLLAPELIAWEHPHVDGAPPRKAKIVQKRVCFTELSPCELPKHATEFGHFALEFEIDTLKSLHALPVFYIPRGANSSSLGQTLVIQLIDAMCLIDRIAQMKCFAATAASGSRQNLIFENRKKLPSVDVDELQRVIEGITFAITPPES